jgi:breast cancer 2 susceptibility protein
MEAQDKSSLSISGNSTCIAPWDAKLGFTNHTFVATLRSLSPEGGSAALLDLTILKMYPIGYREVGEEHKEKAPWNEVEEQARLVAWERKRREAGEQAQRQFETMLNRLADITERATTLRAHPAAEPRADFDVEELLDELAEAKTLAALSTLDKPQLNEIIELGNERIQGLQNDAQTHIAEEMEVRQREVLRAGSPGLQSICPQPKISNFRILQVRDSIASDFGMEGQLTVYSALNYEGEFAVGNRYWVTNVKPRGGSWSKSTAREGEVFIMAGAGSRFMKRPAI